MPGNLQPLVSNQPIVKADGTPTEYFIRWAQERQIDIGEGISSDQAQQLIVDYLAAHALQAGTGIAITPDGKLSSDPTISLDAKLGDLSDVDFTTTAPTDGQVIVYDAATETWLPADQSGGGGGGGGDWAFDPPAASSVTLFTGDATAPTAVNDTDVGLIVSVGPNNNDGPYRGFTVPIPAGGDAQMTVRYNFTGTQSRYTAPAFGILVPDNTRGRVLWMYKNSNQYNCVRWRQGISGQNTSNDGDLDWAYTLKNPTWIRVIQRLSGVTDFYMSSNGKTWVQVYSTNDGYAPDRFMVAVRIASGDGGLSFLTVDHFTVELVP